MPSSGIVKRHAKMEVTLSSHTGASALGIVLVLGERHKIFDADLGLTSFFWLHGTWTRKQDTGQSRIMRSHLHILTSEFPVLPVLKERKFVFY